VLFASAEVATEVATTGAASVVVSASADVASAEVTEVDATGVSLSLFLEGLYHTNQ
jgi:hypothetical protein